MAGALVEERARIARELHDIVAHCVGVMVIQAGAAEDLLGRAPADARAPLRAVQHTGQQAAAELSRMLGLLPGGGERELTPQPGTGELAELVDGVRRAGLPVAMEVRGPARPLPPGVDLAVYRVVQEALTNTLKHAGPATARVLLTYDEHEVRAEVVDDGRTGPAPGTGGHGLLVLTTFDDDEYIYAALQAGASGFLLKSAPPRELAGAIRTVAAGDALLAPEITRRMIADYVRRPRPQPGTPAALRPLTPRELDVFALLAKGRSNAEIAAGLYPGEPTVKTHVTRILAKLALRDRVQAVVLAYECGLVRPGQPD